MPRPSVAIRLGTEGKATVKADFAEIGEAGTTAAQRMRAAFERDAAAAERAIEKVNRTASRLAAASDETVLSRVNRVTGVAGDSSSAAASAAVYERQFAALDARARALVLAMDPLAAAQDRFNREMLEARQLVDAGALSMERYQQKLAIEQGLLDQATIAQQRHGLAVRGNGMIAVQASQQFQDFFIQVSNGGSILAAGAMQMSQLAYVMQGAEGSAGKFAKFLAGPWGAGVMGATVVLGYLTQGLFANNEASRTAATGADALGRAQSVLGQMFDLTTGKIAHQNQLLILNARLTAINLRAEAQQRRASAEQTFREGTEVSTGSRIAAFLARGSGSAADRRRMVEQGPAHLRQYVDAIRNARTEEARTAAMDRALRGTERYPIEQLTGITADQWRQAIIDMATATQNDAAAGMIDRSLNSGRLDPGVRRSGGGGGSGAGGRSSGGDDELSRARQVLETLRDETAARAAINAQMEAGNLSSVQMRAALADEAQLRPLLKLQAEAQGNEYRSLSDVLGQYREALERAREAETHTEALQAIQSLREANQDARALLNFGGDDAARRLEEARLAAEREADQKGYQFSDREQFVGAHVDQARLQLSQERADLVRRTIEDQQEALQQLRDELSLGGLSSRQRESTLRMLAMERQLNRDLGTEYGEKVRQILAAAQAEEELRRRLEQLRATMDEVRQVGGNIVDEILDVDNWDDWGEAGKRILRELLQEMLTLAAANPLKNMLFGSNLPTINSVLGAVFGGGGTISGLASDSGLLAAASALAPGAFASGTQYSPGGWAWMNENGRELVKLPRGSQVVPAAETRRMMASNDQAPSVNVNYQIDARGADAAAIAQLEARLNEKEQRFAADVIAAFNEARARFVIR